MNPLFLDVASYSRVLIYKKKLFFSSDAREDAPMTMIDGEDARDELVDVIFSINANGGTCLGEGVRQGLEEMFFFYRT